MTMDTLGDSPWPMRAVEYGWNRLKDGAQAAMTYFKPHGDDVSLDPGQRWGALATDVVDHQKALELPKRNPGRSERISIAVR